MKLTEQSSEIEQSNEKESTGKPERRKSTDFWIYSVRVLSIISWLLFLIALVLSYYAAPEKSYGVVRYYNIEVRESWITPLAGYLYLVLWFCAFISYLSLIIDKFRTRRNTDSKQFNLVLLLTLTVVWIVYILLHI